MHTGNFVLTLHTHLPYVLNHGVWPHGSDWLCEAVAECYIPLLNVVQDLEKEGIAANITFDISPVNCEQLADPAFVTLFEEYCKNKQKLAREDADYFTKHRHEPHQIYLAHYWEQWYGQRLIEFKERHHSSIINSMKALQDKGLIEVITCGATHGYFALIGDDRYIRLQIKAAIENYKKHFGKNPRGMWLPECAYRPAYQWQTLIPTKTEYNMPKERAGIEELLHEFGIEYFFTDQHLSEQQAPLGVLDNNDVFVPLNSQNIQQHKPFFSRSVLQPVHIRSVSSLSGNTAVMFSRHQKVAMQVWSGESGYPGDPVYLDFHKKHWSSGLRYWRVTDNKADMMYKLLYVPDWIEKRAEMHAFHFIKSVEQTLSYWASTTGRFGTLCAPFDTELFGHWWFEGPAFLKAILKGLHYSPYVNTVTASQQLDIVRPRSVSATIEGSWGRNGNHEVWMGQETKWTWEVIYADEVRLTKLLENYRNNSSNAAAERLLKQAVRELMLLHSSDWQFLISTVSAKDYAEMRFSFHHSDFNMLCQMSEKYIGSKKRLSKADKEFVEELEKKNNVFPEISLEWIPR